MYFVVAMAAQCAAAAIHYAVNRDWGRTAYFVAAAAINLSTLFIGSHHAD